MRPTARQDDSELRNCYPRRQLEESPFRGDHRRRRQETPVERSGNKDWLTPMRRSELERDLPRAGPPKGQVALGCSECRESFRQSGQHGQVGMCALRRACPGFDV